jgi:hypothetical protein
MAITNTVGGGGNNMKEGENTTKGAKGDRGGPKIYIVVRRYFRPAKIVRSSPKICEVVRSFFSDGYSDERILKRAQRRGIRDEDDKGCYD